MKFNIISIKNFLAQIDFKGILLSTLNLSYHKNDGEKGDIKSFNDLNNTKSNKKIQPQQTQLVQPKPFYPPQISKSMNVNELFQKFTDISPNILNLCNDLSRFNYQFKITNDGNLGIFIKNDKLIEFPIDCHQPDIKNCIDWSGIEFANNQNKQNMIAELYLNMLGLKDREYINIFKTDNKFKRINLKNVRHSYPLFTLNGSKNFINTVTDAIKNIIYTDPGKLLMYRLFLASAEKQDNPDLESDKESIIKKLGRKINSRNLLMEYKFPIKIEESFDGSIHSIKNSRIGITFDRVDLFGLIFFNEKSTLFGPFTRPLETGIYHEFVHVFKQLYFIQLVKSNLNHPYILDCFYYKLRYSESVNQLFNLFCEYNNIKEPIDKKTIYDIFCSLILYRDALNVLASNEEFTTMIGIYPGSKYYYPGAELSENLFRHYTNIPIRDTHLSDTEALNYSQSYSFISSIKNKISSLNLKYSKINFNITKEKGGAIQKITYDDFIKFNNEQINSIKSINTQNNNNVKEIVTGYKGLEYKLLESSLLYGIFGMLDQVKYFSKDYLSFEDIKYSIESQF